MPEPKAYRRSLSYSRRVKPGYQTDLAYIHDTGFTDFTRRSAPGLLGILRRHKIERGLVVDLGCGSGVWAETLISHGYEVLGIDSSPSMLRLARRRAPKARFTRASLFHARLPKCAAITAVGECLNYAFDRSANVKLEDLFRRVHKALAPGGVFIFDIAEPGRVGPVPTQNFFLGSDWAVLVRNEGDRRRRLLTRHMTIFRRIGTSRRHTTEIHHQNLFQPSRIEAALKVSGFTVTRRLGYGGLRLGKGRSVFIARNPH